MMPRPGGDARAGRKRLGSPSVSEEVVEPLPPTPCGACRGTGVVLSGLGGEQHELPCPWCEGGGVLLRDHDAQTRWRDTSPN